MRLVHLSDLHLGFRAFPRADRGWNLRERDMASAFRWAIQEIVRLEPGLVVFSGDIFDRPDPPNTAYVALQRGLRILRTHLPGVQVLAIAGERDTPRNPADPGPLAVLDGLPGVEAAAGAPRAVRFRDAGVHVLLVPHRAVLEPPLPALRPDPAARWNVLVVRGRVADAPSGVDLDPGEWSYVAIGGPHDASTWAPNVRAAGALERPGRNPWRQATEERGFLSFDLETGAADFHPVPGRPVVDFAPVRVSPQDREAGTRRLRELVEGVPGGTEDRIVRFRLRGDVLAPGDAISEGLLSALRRGTAHAEIHMIGEGSRPHGPRGRGEGTDLVLRLEPGGEGGADVLPLQAGIVLLTAGSEADRARLVRALVSAGAGDVGATASGLRVVHDSGADPGAALPTATEPAHLLRTLLVQDSLPGWPADGADSQTVAGQASPEPDAKSESSKLAVMEVALTELRADSIEAAGDLESRTLQWARDRQEADTKLLDYRDRARELTTRIRALESGGDESRCPTCGRPLGAESDRLATTLSDELEIVVQDGKWWKKRREQLEEKPKEMQELEEHVLRLHAQVEDEAERLQAVRASIPERGADGGIEAGMRVDGPGPPASALEGLPGLRRHLRRCGNLLASMTEGRVTGVRNRDGRLWLVEPGGREVEPGGTDLSALRLVIRFVAWELSAESGRATPVIVLPELGGPVEESFACAAVEVLSDRLPEGSLAVVVAPPAVAENLPERLAQAFDLTPDPRGRWKVRRIPVGTAELSVRGGSRAHA